MALIQRKAKLFEAGNYPDRGGEYTEQELDRWCENHRNRTIPLSIGHLATDGPENPLPKIGESGMGFFTNLYRLGKELFADLFIDDAVNSLVERSGKRGLSLGIDREAGVIVEGSWVDSPRIASAAMFNSNNVVFQFAGSIAEMETPQPPQEGRIMPPTEPQEPVTPVTPPVTPTVDPKFAADLDAQKTRAEAAEKRLEQQESETAELRKKLEFAEDSKAFDAAISTGKLLPAQATVLLSICASVAAPVKVTFADDEPQDMRLASALAKFFESYDPALVVAAQLPKNLQVADPTDTKFSADELSQIRRKGESLGHTGDALEAYVNNATRFITEVTS